MAHIQNITTLPQGVLNISGSSIRVNGVLIISGSSVEITGSLFGSYMSGTSAVFTSFTGSGANITDITSSNITNFTTDVRSQFTAGTNITIVNGEISSTAGGGGTPGGTEYSIQFNSGSTFSGSSNLIYNYNTNTLSGTISQFTGISSSYLVLSGTTEPTQTEGTIFYDNTNGLLRQWTEVTDVDLHLGQQLAVRVKNDSGTTLAKGKIVHITGSTNSDTPLVTTASYESDSVSADTLGVLMSQLAPNDIGYALLYGVLTGIDLSTYASGDMLYLSSSGDFTNVVTQSPLHEVRIGQVTRATNNGAMFVRIQNGYEIDELHDVLISGKQNGDLLSWDSSALVWKNTKTLSGSYTVTGTLNVNSTLNIGETSNYLQKSDNDLSLVQGYSSTGTLYLAGAGDVSINIDSNNNDIDTKTFKIQKNSTTTGTELFRVQENGRVGIGTSTPSYNLDAYNGSTRIDGIRYDETLTNDGYMYFAAQKYIEHGNFNKSNIFKGGTSGDWNVTQIDNNTTSSDSVPFSTILYHDTYSSFYTDLIPVQAGETIYGEVWCMRETGATGSAGTLYVGIERFDKDKNPIATNSGANYFVASNVTVPSTSTWTKYSGVLTLPLTHTPYNGSDGGPVRYIRLRHFVNYSSGTIRTYWGGLTLRRQNIIRDQGAVTFGPNTNVGIGITNPQDALSIGVPTGTTKGIFFQDGLTTNYGTKLKYDEAANKFFIEQIENGIQTGLLTIQRNNGSVGIGTTSPASALHIVSTNSNNIGATISEFRNASNAERIRIIDENATGTKPPGLKAPTSGYGLGLYASAGPIIFYTEAGETEKLRINSNGNVGIGTTSPTTKLDVYNGVITARSNTNASYFEAVKPDAYSLQAFKITDGTNAVFRIYDRGSVVNRIDIESMYGRNLILKTGLNNNETLSLQGSVINFVDADTPYSTTMTITNNNVGIGILSPGAKLDVSGSTIFGKLLTDTHQFTGSVNITGSLIISGTTNIDDIIGTTAEFTTLTASNAQITNLTVDTITAREYYTELVSSSIIYQSGSTKFGDTSDDIHNFTGSVNILSGNLMLGAPGENIDRTLTIHGSSASNKLFYITQTLTGPILGYGVGNQDISFGTSVSNWQYMNHYASAAHRFFIGSNQKVTIDNNGYVGVGTSPLWKLHLSGASSSNSGPHIVATTDQDLYPLVQHLNHSHDNIAINFDSYYDGIWKSSDAGSNFQIYKVSDALNFRYDNGKTAGSALAWSNGITLSKTGLVGIGTSTPTHKLNVVGDVGIGATGSISTNYMLDIASTKGSGNYGAVRVKAPTVGGSLTNTEAHMLSDIGGWRAIYAKQGSATSAIYADGTSHFTGSMQVIGNVDITGSLSIDGFSTSWGTTLGIEDQGINVRLGTGANATWLLYGTSNGTFRGGIQQLDGGNGARWYTNGTSQNAYLYSGGLQLSTGDFSSTSGRIKIGNGTEAAPAFSFWSEPDTGMYLPAANELGFSTAGSERVRIDNNGLVGIGTTTPVQLLDVRTATATAGQGARLGEAKVGTWYGTDYAEFSHYNNSNSLTDYALLQRSNGSTSLNAKSGQNINFSIANVSKMTLDSSGNFDVSGSTIFGRLSSDTHQFSGSVNVSGTLTATAKSFDIEHPTKEGMRLRYGSLEGPENGVYIRGTITSSVIELPEHWTGLVDEQTITVNLTPVGGPQQVWIEDIKDNKIYIGGDLTKCYYMVLGERKDIDKLVVEY